MSQKLRIPRYGAEVYGKIVLCGSNKNYVRLVVPVLSQVLWSDQVHICKAKSKEACLVHKYIKFLCGPLETDITLSKLLVNPLPRLMLCRVVCSTKLDLDLTLPVDSATLHQRGII